MKKIDIPQDKITQLTKEIDRLNRKYTGSFALEITNRHTKRKEVCIDGDKGFISVPYCTVSLSGEMDTVDGWSVIGVISDIREEKSALITVPTVDFDEIKEKIAGRYASCDHCKKKRQRKQTIVLKNKDELKIIGKKCIEAYLGVSASALLSRFSYFNNIIKTFYADDLENYDHHTAEWFDLHEFVARSYIQISKYGYISKKQAQWDEFSTGESVLDSMVSLSSIKLTEDDIEKAQSILDYLRSFDQSTNYGHNLVHSVTANDDYIKTNHSNIVASGVYMYLKNEKNENKSSNSKTDVDVKEGRQEFFGKIVKFKDAYYNGNHSLKAMIECEGFKVYGTIPSKYKESVAIGSVVSFTATASPQRKGFAFYNRPSGFTIKSK